MEIIMIKKYNEKVIIKISLYYEICRFLDWRRLQRGLCIRFAVATMRYFQIFIHKKSPKLRPIISVLFQGSAVRHLFFFLGHISFYAVVNTTKAQF